MIGNEKMVTSVLDETEKTAKYAGLGKRETLHLCLLAEVLVGILLGLAGKFRAEFWIEEGGGTFQLFLTADARLGRENRKKLSALARSGKMKHIRESWERLVSLWKRSWITMMRWNSTVPGMDT